MTWPGNSRKCDSGSNTPIHHRLESSTIRHIGWSRKTPSPWNSSLGPGVDVVLVAHPSPPWKGTRTLGFSSPFSSLLRQTDKSNELWKNIYIWLNDNSTQSKLFSRAPVDALFWLNLSYGRDVTPRMHRYLLLSADSPLALLYLYLFYFFFYLSLSFIFGLIKKNKSFHYYRSTKNVWILSQNRSIQNWLIHYPSETLLLLAWTWCNDNGRYSKLQLFWKQSLWSGVLNTS